MPRVGARLVCRREQESLKSWRPLGAADVTGDAKRVYTKELSPVQINISSRHGQLSEATREKIKSKVEKLVRVFERLTAIEVTVDLAHRTNPEVDLRANAEHKHDFVATERSEELFVAVDNAVHKIEQQLRKYKEKVQDHHRNLDAHTHEVPAEPEPGA